MFFPMPEWPGLCQGRRCRIEFFQGMKMVNSLRAGMLIAITSVVLVGCGGGYSYSPPPPPAPGSGAEAQVDPNAGVSIDPALMSQGMDSANK
jgi:hypothetical protein